MMNMNVNQMTSAFSKMPDAALKQYAMMHKNDPYTMSLVMSESNRRKQLRDGAQGQAPQQPTVVDQELAQMGAQPQAMPENTGIGTLPQQPMQMAEGGIIAFAKGGSPEDEQAEEDRAKALGLFDYLKSANRNAGAAIADIASMPVRGLAGAYDSAVVRPMRAMGANASYLSPFLTPAGADVDSATPFADLQRTRDAAPNPAAMGASSNADRGTFAGQGATGTNTPAVPDTTGAADKGGIKDLTVAPRAAAAPAAPQKRFEDYFKSSMDKAKNEKDPFEQDTKNITATAKKGKEDELTAFRKEILAENAEMFKGREERIGKREASLEKSKDTNTGMAFLQAGLAMMQARGPGLAGIAQGAGVGLSAYGAGIDKIKSAQEKLDESRDRIDELRQNKSSMDKRTERAKESGINDLVTQGERDLLAGKKALDAQARALAGTAAASNVATDQSALERQSRITAAGIAAAPGLERNKILQASQDDQAKIRTAYGTLQTKVMAELAKDPTYSLATDAQKDQMQTTRLRQALQNNPFLSMYASGVGFPSTPVGAVRELDPEG